MAETSIEWTDWTLNPGIYGCDKYGAGCLNCYATLVAKGLEDKARGIAAKNPDAPPSPYAGVSDGTDWIGGVRVDPVEKAVARILAVPKARNGAPRRVFVTSMADFLHADVPFDWIVTCIEAMAGKPDHRWQVLTKRGQRWPEVSEAVVAKLGGWPRNVWAGLSVAHQPDTRLIPYLLAVPDAVRFLSVEPLVGRVDLTHLDVESCPISEKLSPIGAFWINALSGRNTDMGRLCPDVPRISWVICGGESGPNARPMHQEWVRSLRDQCVAAGVPFFFKQWGEWAPDPISGIGMIRVGKKRAGRILDGREWSEVPRG